jgi:hypothetical protein
VILQNAEEPPLFYFFDSALAGCHSSWLTPQIERNTFMIKLFRPHPKILLPLQSGPLAPHLVSFAALLANQRYCREIGWNKLRLVAALSCWMHQGKIQLKDL